MWSYKTKVLDVKFNISWHKNRNDKSHGSSRPSPNQEAKKHIQDIGVYFRG